MVADWVVKLHEKKVGYLMSLIVLMLGSSDTSGPWKWKWGDLKA